MPFSYAGMDKETALTALLQRCFDARLPVGELCCQAGVAKSTVSRWKKDPARIGPRTLAKLEASLAAIEQERAA